MMKPKIAEMVNELQGKSFKVKYGIFGQGVARVSFVNNNGSIDIMFRADGKDSQIMGSFSNREQFEAARIK